MPTKDKTKTKKKIESRIPEGIDTTALRFLEKGDNKRIAIELGLGETGSSYVSRVKMGECYNVKILAALIKKGLDNKKTLNP